MIPHANTQHDHTTAAARGSGRDAKPAKTTEELAKIPLYQRVLKGDDAKTEKELKQNYYE